MWLSSSDRMGCRDCNTKRSWWPMKHQASAQPSNRSSPHRPQRPVPAYLPAKSRGRPRRGIQCEDQCEEGEPFRRTRACSHYFFEMRCGSKRPCARREMQPGYPPGQASQRRARPFWPQPEGKGVQAAPLIVARLGQTPSLAVVARLDWRCLHPFRT